ncbi:hypothetical protein J2787_000495 [Chryseobacterium rhizosphaerae]|uniref:Uncharacterized protein n=1 Tax=Chryseobacterium rhizosphaerae TaxID=395937 RepID=A0AAE4C2X5_9FLAO|nr:hypothetical protein [Chryseobacterium rhizosphaerae]MDR6547870.1 hypothetical protein [Chryseobacterium rhizosphaerae]
MRGAAITSKPYMEQAISGKHKLILFLKLCFIMKAYIEIIHHILWNNKISFYF